MARYTWWRCFGVSSVFERKLLDRPSLKEVPGTAELTSKVKKLNILVAANQQPVCLLTVSGSASPQVSPFLGTSLNYKVPQHTKAPTMS